MTAVLFSDRFVLSSRTLEEFVSAETACGIEVLLARPLPGSCQQYLLKLVGFCEVVGYALVCKWRK